MHIYTCKRLFTTAGIRDRWTDRIIELLEVPVTRDDGLPAQICSSCSTKVRTIEDSLECLLEMRQSAKMVMEHFLGRSETLKRMKDTSGSDVVVSPHTAISSMRLDRPRLTTVSHHHHLQPSRISSHTIVLDLVNKMLRRS